MAIVRVSGVQMAVSPNLGENLEKILYHIENNDSDFIVFPEMSLNSPCGDFNAPAVRKAWRQIATACRQGYVTAVIGTVAQEDGATHIQSRVYGDTGKLIGTHEKLVPTSEERAFCRPGEELRVFRHHDITFGCLIGNDLWVTPGCGPYPDPRLSLKLSKLGAQIIFHSVNSGISALHLPYHESNLVLRAVEGGLHIVTVNAAHPKGPVNAPTGVVSPKGEWLVKLPRTGERQFVCDLEVEGE